MPEKTLYHCPRGAGKSRLAEIMLYLDIINVVAVWRLHLTGSIR